MSSFTTLLLKLSDDLTSGELERLKFLCKKEIGAAKLERITTGHQLFETLEQLNLLSERKDKRDYLATRLADIERNDLSERLVGFQEEESPPFARFHELGQHLPNVTPTAPPSTGAHQQPHEQQVSQALSQSVNNFSSARSGLDDEDSGAGADEPNGAGPDLRKASPEVFISYKWYGLDTAAGVAVMKAISSLESKLEGKGYRCWRDKNQMGGGDHMNTKIDEGIRGSKVVICCVTEEFCRSKMCQREVTLADEEGKYIIPLLFESVKWPPKGQLAVIFAPLIFIEMSKTLESAGYFPKDKLQELFQQVREKVGH